MNNTKKRNKAIVAAALKYIDEQVQMGYIPNLNEVVEAIVAMPAPAFYIGFESLCRSVRGVLRRHDNGKPSANLSQLRIMTVVARVSDILSREKISIAAAVTRVMAQPAPSFYVAPRTVRKILSEKFRVK